MTSALLDKLNMSCGDFIDLVANLESHNSTRQLTHSNLKKAGKSTDSDIYRTPPTFEHKKLETQWKTDNHDNESPQNEITNSDAIINEKQQ